MKIVVLYGNMPHYDYGLSKVIKVIQDTLAELDVGVEEVNLGLIQPPYFDGIGAQATDDILHCIRESSGVILACTAQLFAPTAIMQTFLEYLELDAYRDGLQGKPCFLVTVSKNGSERSALAYLTRVLQHLGGYNTVSVGLQEKHTLNLESDDLVREFVEKETEYYYRVIRQGRQYIIPQDYPAQLPMPLTADMDFAQQTAVRVSKPPKERVPVSEVYKKLNLDAFTERQEQDIEMLTKFFADKYTNPETPPEPAPTLQRRAVAAPQPRPKTVRQITQSLPHYFQPQLSNGLIAVIQFNITGSDAFDGYLAINNTECEYQEGQTPVPDITITADTTVWGDILRSKYTAQKAFMIGGLKVRGKNFALLTRFDALFKLNA